MIPGAKPKRVLIADDSRTVRNLVKTFIEERTDLEVCGEADDGQQAVEKTRALEPDLVLLDLSMPRMNGAEAASLIKKSNPNVRIILFTMYSENIGRSLTAAIGVEAVLSKPDGIAALVRTIGEVLDAPRAPPESQAVSSVAAPSAEWELDTISFVHLLGRPKSQ
ncbi:MAG: response regulator transcription factor [Candidatus Acidiferrum sp.]